MKQIHVVIVFIVLVLIGLISAGANALKVNFSGDSITPTPTEGVLFNQNDNKLDKNVLSSESTITPTTQAQITKQPLKQYRQFPGSLSESELINKKAVIQTDKGSISLEINPEATKAASNFIFLAKDGFYDGLTFHRVEPGFVVQGGDPVGNGTGGPGYTFTEDKVVGKYDRGIVAMAKKANELAGTGGSQFFIMLEDKPLPLEYVIFGKVVSGMDIVDQIKVGDVMRKVTIVSLQ
ncbi:MAG: peptidylprolyl isomerase [Microgenomates group bacterium]|jgi:cyclophilin family peptidyl-prolyl cis-trans isomerase